jgi:erythromycin esterase-like protein
MLDRRAGSAAAAIRQAARPLSGLVPDLDPLIERVGDASVVLIGEASHGTHEFYRTRAEITRRLVMEKGFTAIAIEGDWPDAWRVNRFVQGREGVREDGTEGALRRAAEHALRGFERFPHWMWRNEDVLEFVSWLRTWNDERPPAQRAGFYGLDLYSLFASMHEVLRYLQRVDPDAAGRARERYSCFDHAGGEAQAYGYLANLGLAESCEREVLQQLVDLRQRAQAYLSRDGAVAAADFFYVEQNARLVLNAERYYREMFHGQASSWNLRDRHMAETLESLLSFLARQGKPARAVVWAHNSHLGDARATDMARRGELNLGQLVRQAHGDDAVLVGFTTYEGTVTAAREWDEPAQRMTVRPALPESYEELFHRAEMPAFLLQLREGDATSALESPRLERFIGVIYRPDTERASHYFHARLPGQFDAVIHFDSTRALEPLEAVPPVPSEESAEVPETWPSGV